MTPFSIFHQTHDTTGRRCAAHRCVALCTGGKEIDRRERAALWVVRSAGDTPGAITTLAAVSAGMRQVGDDHS
jgi:hypothetical protein